MYRIDRYDTTRVPITVDDAEIKTQSGISWVGQFHSRYGEILHENFLHVVENFSSPIPPSSIDTPNLPFKEVEGMLWHDTGHSDSILNKGLKIKDGNFYSGTDGWKNLELIINNQYPQYHTQGEVFYDTRDKTYSISRGTYWDDLTVKKALDSELLDGLDSLQFLRSDVDDIMYGTLQTSDVYPRTNKVYKNGLPTNKWAETNTVHFSTETTDALIPKNDNAHLLGNQSKRWSNIHTRLANIEFYEKDVLPVSNYGIDLGDPNYKFDHSYMKYLHTEYSDNLYPIANNSQQLGSPSLRWNKGYINLLDVTRVTSGLVPNTANVYDLGTPSLPWRELYVGHIDNHSSKHIWPLNENTYDLGKTTNQYRTGYFRNLDGFNALGDIVFGIVPSGRSNGIVWSGLSDTHHIKVVETSGTENTKLEIASFDDYSDHIVFRVGQDVANSREVMAVQYNDVIVKAGNLKTQGSLEVETNNKGCHMEFNESTNTLEFSFY